jgi:hypothetical protein
LRLLRAERAGTAADLEVSPDVVTRQWRGHLIRTRLSDGYVDATDMCAATGKLWANYYQTQETQAFLAALSQKIGIPINGGNGLVQAKQRHGTWVHPDVAIHLAQWCDAASAVEVAQWYRY